MTLLILFFSLIGSPQDDPNREIMKPIENLFLGMETVDSTLTKSAFTENPSMYTVVESPQGTRLQKGDYQRFLNFIGSPRQQLIAEPIWDAKIDQDGDFAQVWVSYALYVGGKVSHCGVDAFQLVKLDGEWKIYTITDTRHKEGCDIPADVIKKYSK